ncbi:MAG: DUF1311 domain-containing protein [Rhodospirillales bacterium]|nr:MAG: DUF1311 domain-containing protein [Rhodospirillales bacterium]
MRRLLAAALLWSFPAYAEATCDRGLDDAALAACLYDAFEQADRRLAELWQRRTVDRMARNEQQAWLAYRDAACARDRVAGGGDAPAREARCLLDMTRERIKRLAADPD